MENTGQILRSRKTGKSRYTPISNEILQSLTLTPDEKSILVHLLSLPEDWIVYKIAFGQQLNMGRHRFHNAWKGLQKKGYIVSVQMIDATSNLMRGWNHIIHEEPVLADTRTVQPSDLPKFGHSENRVVNKVINEQSNNLTNECVVEPPTKQPIKKFIKPTVDQIKEYMNSKGLADEAERFHDYYTANGWKVGKNPMKDWEAAVRNWGRGQKQTTYTPKKPKLATL